MDHPAYPDPWPLRGLVLRTPRLELRPDDDAGLDELVATAYAGVHPPEQMPFDEPWTDADPRCMGRATEMRAAVLLLTFDHLGARTARSAAFVDNPASLAVSRTLGYLPDGMDTRVRRGEPAEQVRLLLTADRFAGHRPPWTVRITGLDVCPACSARPDRLPARYAGPPCGGRGPRSTGLLRRRALMSR